MAESLTVQTFLARYPEFATQPPERVAQALEDAIPGWMRPDGSGVCARNREPGGPFCLVHPGLGADSAAARGVVVSERAGDLHISYAALPSDSASDAWLATSVYGQRYLTLRRMIGLGLGRP
ncbi:DUF4054 domain-containing protein [Xylella fastidiosa subsp. multiplex]|uniref:DUF4054 domain-containing protein n=1 Tax=Xylella fastidiosa subsp. multiplex TaxID=644357 RepID=A0AAW6HQI8_XYLFS|nr:DUF4054 domain-containing protein [Xylella fastidiosa subsp. multiplex]